ncbi:MAG: HEPN domain-containing protein [Melioribacteraceae bacterium]|nr:HEPN domain-containing protein [Melioribacteraceae bacterium]
MDEKIKNSDEVVQHWLKSAEQNYMTMKNLVASNDFSWALFMGHLVIEKLLKAIYVDKFHKHAMFTHDLLRLANKSKLKLSMEHEEWFDKITTFNLNARYDNYKQDFYKLCTKEFTDKWIDKIEKLRQWLIKQL